MLAKIDIVGNDDEGKIVISLQNGRVLHALMSETITIVENTTGLAASVAEHAAGVAWAMNIDDGVDSIPWRRLVNFAERSLKDFKSNHLRMN